MYQIREVFRTKPGKAKDLVKKFKLAAPHFEKANMGENFRIMTDAVGKYWTVIMEYEVADLGKYFSELRGASAAPELQDIMKGYIDLVEGGKREIYVIE
jgi:hypothetical protein